MKLNCGMDWADKCEYLRNWQLWFAWRPVRIGSHDCRWLEFIERRQAMKQIIPLHGSSFYWEYRAIPTMPEAMANICRPISPQHDSECVDKNR